MIPIRVSSNCEREEFGKLAGGTSKEPVQQSGVTNWKKAFPSQMDPILTMKKRTPVAMLVAVRAGVGRLAAGAIVAQG